MSSHNIRVSACSEESRCKALRCVDITLGFPRVLRTPDVVPPGACVLSVHVAGLWLACGLPGEKGLGFGMIWSRCRIHWGIDRNLRGDRCPFTTEDFRLPSGRA